jgi:cell division protein FtsB
MLFVIYLINFNLFFFVLFIYLVQKNALNQSLKQIRTERDELFVNNQKLKQEKLAAEVCFVLFDLTIKKKEIFLRQKKVQVQYM